MLKKAVKFMHVGIQLGTFCFSKTERLYLLQETHYFSVTAGCPYEKTGVRRVYLLFMYCLCIITKRQNG